MIGVKLLNWLELRYNQYKFKGFFTATAAMETLLALPLVDLVLIAFVTADRLKQYNLWAHNFYVGHGEIESYYEPDFRRDKIIAKKGCKGKFNVIFHSRL